MTSAQEMARVCDQYVSALWSGESAVVVRFASWLRNHWAIGPVEPSKAPIAFRALGNFVDRGCNPDGNVIVIDGLKVGNYFLVESKAPVGYKKAADSRFTIVAKTDVAATVVDTPTTKAVIRKQSETVRPLTGACFEVDRAKSGGGRGEIAQKNTCDNADGKSDAYLTFNLPPGDFILVETKPPGGYLKGADKPFTISAGLDTDLTVTNVLGGSVRDRESGTGTFNKSLDAITILSGLESGEYWIAEKSAPKGYFKAADDLVEITESKTEVTVLDEPWPVLTITKVDDTGAAVKGACFQLF